LGGYRGNGIIRSGDKDKLSRISHTLIIAYAVAAINQLRQICGRGPASAGYGYHRVAFTVQSNCQSSSHCSSADKSYFEQFIKSSLK
jgi:hypothetical protein